MAVKISRLAQSILQPSFIPVNASGQAEHKLATQAGIEVEKLHLAATVKLEDKRRKSGHTRPRQPIISLDQPGRLRVAHLLAILGVSHSTLYAGIRSGRYPKCDGRDGAFPFWRTSTIKAFLES
jgi:hypothetical protein